MTQPVRVSALLFLFLLCIYSLLRFGFFLANAEFFAQVPGDEIRMAFLHGLRFDVAALLLVNVPLLLIHVLPGRPARFRWVGVPLFLLFCLVNIAGLLLNVADFEYFPTIQRRLLFEPYTMLPDLLRMMPATIAAYPLTALIFAGAAALFIAVAHRLIRSSGMAMSSRRGWIRESVFFVVILLLAVIGIRGGLQLKPLRQSNAFTSAVPAVGWLTLNSTYTVARSYFQPALPEYGFYPDDEARTALRAMLFSAGDRATDSVHVFERYSAGRARPRLNIVILIMESWTASFHSSISGKNGYTPFFDSLASQGLLFTNFLANGQRSIEALPSILASVPGLYETSLIGSKAETNRFRGLGSILMENGYTTSFHHGAATGSMGFDAFSRMAGFMRYFGKEDFPGLADSLVDGVWGLNDEPFFLQACDDISALPEPFCSALFSLSSHVPFELPRHREKLFHAYAGEGDFERSLRYADFSLGRFFERAKTKPWFPRTIFVITGDHTMFGARNNLHAAFHIPTLLYAPGIIPPGRDTHVASHVDLLPTLLDAIDLAAVHASMGRSTLSEAQRLAVVRYGPLFCCFGDSLVYTSDVENEHGLYNYRRDPERRRDLRASMPREAASFERTLRVYLQTVTRAVAEDKVYSGRR